MRISVHEDDPGYPTWVQANREEKTIRVRVDDLDVSDRCEMADDELGEAICGVKDERGDFVLNEACDAVLRETLRGKVEIVLE